MKKLIFSAFICSSLSVALGQSPVSPEILIQQSERRQEAINQQIQPTVESRSSLSELSIPIPSVGVASHCFPIHTFILQSIDKGLPPGTDDDLIAVLSKQKIMVNSYSDNRFSLLSSGANVDTPCLSASRIEQIVAQLQNKLIGRGLITTRVLTPEQNLSSGELVLSIATGKIAQIVVNQENIEQTHANRANVTNAFPTGNSDTLNLRDLEQGLENLRRLPTVSAKMDIDAGESANTSNVKVDWSQRKYPLRLNVSIDDSGSDSTGKYLGTASVAWDNPLQLNDILSASYTHSLKPGVRLNDPQGGVDKSKTNNYALNYSVPWGYWLLDVGMSNYHYDQVVAGVNRNYHYTGDSIQGNVDISRVLYRDDKHKISANVGIWGKDTKSFIDDAEVEVQHRRTGGWKAGLSQRSYFSSGTLTSALTYKRGTRAFGAIPAPEELFNEGTAKAKIWTADVNWSMPFTIANQSFNWDSKLHGQYTHSRLTSQDKIAIGGRYSVRGFSERSLSAERGWYLRNDLSWRYLPHHQLYLGVDVGRVSGPSSEQLLGQSLSGATLGLKGQFRQYGDWSYDVFVGSPVTEPDNFSGDKTFAGFSLNYSL